MSVSLEEKKDDLTGLLTKHGFIEKMEVVIADFNQEKRNFSIVLVDLDHFKKFNDEYGHGLGDEYIKKAADVLRKNLRDEDIICRFGGEEFCIFVPDASPEATFMMIEDIRRLLTERNYTLQYQDQKVERTISFSGGISGFPKDGKDVSEIIRAADEALYRSKLSGRNRLSFAVTEKMKTKTNYYTTAQIERLANLSKKVEKSESLLLREALDELLKKYGA